MKRQLLTLGALGALACSTSPRSPLTQRIPSDSTEFYRTQAQQMATVQATKDSLFRDVAESTKLLADINTELARVHTGKKAMEPVSLRKASCRSPPPIGP